jgi:hypothetical protein
MYIIFRQLVSVSWDSWDSITRKNLTTCQQDVFATGLSTSCNNVVVLSSCYKVVTHNLLTNC